MCLAVINPNAILISLQNEQEHYRTELSSNVDDKTIHELYLWYASIPVVEILLIEVRPFADAVRAGVGSIMCSYNEINNTYACENSYVLNHLLKDELDFQGFGKY
jgi:beta-glucosidase